MIEHAPEKLRVLVVEDNPSDSYYLRVLLEEQVEPAWPQSTLDIVWVDRVAAALAVLGGAPMDVVLLDPGLPDSRGVDALQRILACRPDIAVIVLTGREDTQTVVESMRGGAQDYLVKGQVTRDTLLRAIRYAVQNSRTEQHIRRHETQIRLLTESMRDLLCTYTMDRQLQFLSPSYEALTGYSAQEARACGVSLCIDPEDMPNLQQYTEDAFHGVPSMNHEVRLRTKSGEAGWLSCSWWPLVDDQGMQVGVAGRATDITERKLADNALRISEQKYRRLFDSMTDAFCRVDMSGNIQETNRAFQTMLGYGAEEMARLTYQDLTPETWHAAEARIIQEQIVARGHSDVYEKEYRRKDETVFPVELRTFLLTDDAGQPSGMWAIVRDITERKRAEEALRESERRYRDLFENASLAVFQVTLDGQIIEVNPEFARMFGYQSAQEFKDTVANAAGIFADPHRRAEIIRLQAENPDLHTFENVYRRKDGSTFIGQLTVMVIKDGSPRDYFEGFIEDITARKHAEDALRSARDYAQNLIQTANAIVVGMDTTGNVTVFNKAAEDVTGYTASELMGRNWFEVVVPRSRYERVRVEFEHVLAGGVMDNYENPILTKSGEERLVIWQNSEVREQGRVVGTISFGIDITERKRAEGALQETERRFASVFSASPVAISITRLDSGQLLDVNDAWLNLTGYTRAEALGHSPVELHLWEDSAQRQRHVDVVCERGEGVAETRLRRISGEVRDLLVSAVIVDLAGARCLLSIGQDITERKKAEVALLASERSALRSARQLQVVNQIGATVAAGLDFERLMQILYEQAQTIGDVHTFYVALYDDASEVLSFPFFCKDGERRVIPSRNIRENAGLAGHIIDHRQTLYIPDQSQLPPGLTPVRQPGIPTVSFVGVPLALNDRVVGVLSMQSHMRDAYSSDQIATLEMLATQVAIAIQNSRLYEQVQRERNLADVVIDNLPGAFCLINREGRMLRWNRFGETRMGFAAGDIANMNVLDLVGPHERPRLIQQMAEVFMSGQATVDVDVLTNDNKGFPMSVTGACVQLGDDMYMSIIGTDITERKRAEEEILRSEEKYRLLFETAGAAIVYWRLDGTVISVNRVAARYIGGQPEDFAGESLAQVYGKERGDLYRSRMEAALASDSSGQHEDVVALADGQHWFMSHYTVVHDAQGQAIGVQVISNDITARKTAEEALQRSLAEMQTLHSITQSVLETKAVASVMQAVAHGVVENLNYAYAVAIGYAESSLTGMAMALYPPSEPALQVLASLSLPTDTGHEGPPAISYQPGANAVLDRIMQGHLVVCTSLADFGVPWLERSAVEAIESQLGMRSYVACPMQVNGHTVGIVVAATRCAEGTAEQQRSLQVISAQAALAMHYAELFDQVSAGRERQQALARRLLEIQEVERRAIARELHDQIGQALTAVKINLQTSERLTDPVVLVRSNQQARAIVDQTLQQVRSLSRDLHPSILDDLGLTPALRWYVDQRVRTSDLAVVLKLGNIEPAPSGPVKIAAFRIAQEALTNVLRHAQAKTVVVEVQQDAETLELIIRDDGVGFDVAAARRDAAGGSSLGIVGMEERADLAGGRLTIEAAPGHGTEVRARFPLADAVPPLGSRRNAQ